MKSVLLLLAAVAWAASQSIPGEITPGLRADREYWYEYESQILTGIPALNLQYSGLKLKARVMLQKGQDEYIIMKLSEVRVNKVKESPEDWKSAREEVYTRRDEAKKRWDEGFPTLNSVDEPRDLDPIIFMPDSLLEELPSETREILVRNLNIPIQFRYERGLVTKVYADGGDPYYSINMKKGIMSMLHLDMNAENKVMNNDVSAALSYMDIVRPDYTSMADKTGFKVKESSTIGDCETYYSIIPDSSLRELRVKKVPITKKCTPKVFAETGEFAGILPIPDNPTKSMLIQPSISTDYLLVGSRHEFTIKKALLTAKYSMSPSSKSSSSMDSFIIQKLDFMKEEAIGRQERLQSTPVHIKTGLKLDLPMMKDITGYTPDRNIRAVPDVDVETKITMIDELLNKIIEKTENGVEEEATDILIVIPTILRKLSKTEILEVCNRFFESSSSISNIEKKREILINVILSVPTPDLGAILKYFITERKITDMTAVYRVGLAVMVAPTSPKVINDFIDLMKNDVVKRDFKIFKSTVLGLAIITNKMINTHKKMQVEPSNIPIVIKSVVKEIKSLLSSERHEYRILAVKAMGNLGVPDILADLERIVKDKTESKEIRAYAIYAMKKLAYKMPKVIRSILLPIYLRTGEPIEIRIASFLMIMETRPGFSTLHIVGTSVNDEKDPQVANYVYNYLQKMAKDPIAYKSPMRSYVKKVLAVMRPIHFSTTFNSRIERYVSYFDKVEAGFGYEVSAIRNRTKLIPDVSVHKTFVNIFGQSYNMGEIGLRYEGLEKIIRKMIGTKGVLYDVLNGRKDFRSIFEPLSEPEMGSSIMSELSSILSKVSELPDMSSIDAMKLGLYYRYLDHEYGFYDLDKESAKGFIEEAMSMYNRIASRLASGIDIDYISAQTLPGDAATIATPIGLPLSMNTTVSGFVTSKGRIEAEGISSIVSIISGSPVKVKFDLRNTVYYKARVSMSFVCDVLETGAEMKKDYILEIPIKAELEVNPTDKKIKISQTMPKSVYPRSVMKLEPSLLTRIIPVSRNNYIASEYRKQLPSTVEIISSKVFKKVDYETEYRMPYVDTKLRVKFRKDIMLPGMIDATTMIHFAKGKLELSLESSSSAPEKTICEIYWGESEPVEVQRTTTSSSWFGWLSGDSSEEVEEESPISSEFMPISPKSIIDSPTIRKLKVYVKTPSTTILKNQIAVVYNPSMSIFQINSQTNALPVFGYRQCKSMVESVLDVSKLMKLYMSAENRRMKVEGEIASTEITYGTTSFNQERINLKMLPYYAKEDPEIPLERGLGSYRDLRVPTLDFKIIAEGSEYFARMARYIPRMSSYALYKPLLPDYMYDEEPLSSLTSSRKAIFAVQIVPVSGKMNCVLATPFRTFYLLSWTMPEIITSQMNVKTPITEMETSSSSFYSSSYSSYPSYYPLYSVCKVRPHYIETMDNIALSYADIDSSCEMVLAHDCSPQKLYTVISTPLSETGARKLKVIIPNYKVELESGPVHTGIVLKINGEVKSISSAPLVRTYTTSDGKVLEMLKVKKMGDRYEIKSPEVGLRVLTNSKFVDIMLSPLLTSSHCGLCSTFPKSHAPIYNPYEIIPRDKLRVYSIRKFIKPYLLSSPTCPASTELPGPTGTCSIVRRNIVINRPDRPSEVCFSVRPVEICSDFCHSKRSVPMSIGFHCVSAEDPFAKEMLRYRHERELIELRNKIAHVQENVDVAQECDRI